jgi:quercetin dioxygenase-like cupin family protein
VTCSAVAAACLSTHQQKRRKMKPIAASVISLALLGAAPAYSESTIISPNGSRASVMGAPANFTGSAIVDPVYAENKETSSSGGHVIFAPGARSAWHTHPAGQTLIVMSGTGWIQEEGGQKREIKPGDVIWTPPGVKHWHGATATNTMSHIAITNMRVAQIQEYARVRARESSKVSREPNRYAYSNRC